MKRLIIATTILTIAGGAMAFAQSGSGGGSGAAAGTGSGAAGSRSAVGQAPVGHLQPRRSDTSSERSIDQVDPADAALDRKIKSICRGC